MYMYNILYKKIQYTTRIVKKIIRATGEGNITLRGLCHQIREGGHG